MFELLLQADRAMSEGLLDQAERTYWQLVDLDPTNAIAVVGLARVSLERGDQRMARMFAARASVMDPENLAARRIVEAIDRRIAGGVEAAEAPEAVDLPEAPDLPLIAARRLEAVSMSRSTGSRRSEEGAGTVSAASAGPSTAALDGDAEGAESGGGDDVEAEAVYAEPVGDARRKGEDKETREATASLVQGRPEAAPAPAAHAAPADHTTAVDHATSSGGEPQPALPPDAIAQPSSEPAAGRRQAGRLAAGTAAAAAAATQQPTHLSRAGSHRAMPSGRGHFDARDLRPPAQDAYSAAEAAAIVEAVDAAEVADAADVAAADAKAAQAVGARDVLDEAREGAVDAIEAASATEPAAAVADEAEDTVAIRIASLADSVQLESAEGEAARAANEEALSGPEVSETVAVEPEEVTSIGEERPVGPPHGDRSGMAEPEAADEFALAEAETARPTPKESLEAHLAAPVGLTEPEVRPRPISIGGAESSSEEDAETEALREALDIVLGSEGDAAQAEPPGQFVAPAGAAETPRLVEPPVPTQAAPEPPAVRRKKGFFNRLRGG